MITKNFAILILTFSIMLCFGNISFAANAIMNNCVSNNSVEVIEQIAFTNKEKDINQKWNDFLKENTRFTESEYIMAIHNLRNIFNKSFSDLNDCIVGLEQEQKQYNSSWVLDLTKQYGVIYLDKNMETIAFIILANHMINDINLCKDQKVKAIYDDFNYTDSVKGYVQLFVDFCNSLKLKEIKLIDIKKSTAETYIRNFHYPMQSMLSLSRVKNELFLAAIKTREDLDQNLVEYITSRPCFKKSYDPMKAIRDLEAHVLTESGKSGANP